ncbi:MAG: OmpP1/FadL family transporter, partial [Nitrospiria bacterium]
FDDSVARNYNDTDTYRFGLTYHYNPALDLLLGFGIDETPVPEKTLGFELPDADALIYSTGFRYRKSDRVAISLTYLTSQKEKRTVTTNDSGIVGNFESGAHLVNASVIITF